MSFQTSINLFWGTQKKKFWVKSCITTIFLFNCYGPPYFIRLPPQIDCAIQIIFSPFIFALAWHQVAWHTASWPCTIQPAINHAAHRNLRWHQQSLWERTGQIGNRGICIITDLQFTLTFCLRFLFYCILSFLGGQVHPLIWNK